MNLNSNPTIEQLRSLIRGCDDAAGDHVLWVKSSGDVELLRIPAGQSPHDFQRSHSEAQLRCETFLAGNEYVGPEAAADDEWVSDLFGR